MQSFSNSPKQSIHVPHSSRFAAPWNIPKQSVWQSNSVASPPHSPVQSKPFKSKFSPTAIQLPSQS